jgi:hypothetical protein
MRSLLISLQSEFYKSRKTLAFWAAILLPLVICGLITIGFFTNAEKVIARNYPPMALWGVYSGTALGIMGMLILPFYVIFMAFSVNNIEHKNDTWKTLFAQPLNKFSIYAAKYLFAVLLIFLSLLLFVTLTIGFGYLLHALNNGLKFNEFSPVEMLCKIYFKLFLSSLGILSVQFIISLIWGDFLKPMGIGFIGVIMGIIVATKGWEHAYLIPYSHPTIVLAVSKTGVNTDIFTKEIYTGLIYALVFFVIGYFIVARKSVK